MGHDEIHKRQHAILQERKAEKRKPKPGSLLIVTEGEKTEPIYLGGMIDYIKSLFGGQLSVCKVEGVGMGTVPLVNKAMEIANRSPFMYETKWVCFDKDDYKDFDVAIKLAKDNDFQVAWSNQSFEYWLYLHFDYCKSALHRDAWFQKVDELFQQYQLGDGRYRKNLENMFTLFASEGKLKAAIANAKRCEAWHKNKRPSQCDPGTTVHYLVDSLKEYLKEFL